jgi:hypothetical protein
MSTAPRLHDPAAPPPPALMPYGPTPIGLLHRRWAGPDGREERFTHADICLMVDLCHCLKVGGFPGVRELGDRAGLGVSATYAFFQRLERSGMASQIWDETGYRVIGVMPHWTTAYYERAVAELPNRPTCAPGRASWASAPVQHARPDEHLVRPDEQTCAPGRTRMRARARANIYKNSKEQENATLRECSRTGTGAENPDTPPALAPPPSPGFPVGFLVETQSIPSGNIPPAGAACGHVPAAGVPPAGPAPAPADNPDPAPAVFAAAGAPAPAPEAEEPDPTPEQVAAWERDQGKEGGDGFVARTCLRIWRERQARGSARAPQPPGSSQSDRPAPTVRPSGAAAPTPPRASEAIGAASGAVSVAPVAAPAAAPAVSDEKPAAPRRAAIAPAPADGMPDGWTLSGSLRTVAGKLKASDAIRALEAERAALYMSRKLDNGGSKKWHRVVVGAVRKGFLPWKEVERAMVSSYGASVECRGALFTSLVRDKIPQEVRGACLDP